MQNYWNDAAKVNVDDGWGKNVSKQTEEAYGVVEIKDRDEKTRRVLAAAGLVGLEVTRSNG